MSESFSHWTNLTLTCYQHNMICEGCPNNNDFVCGKSVWNNNPYKIRNIKYATLRTLSKVGEPKKKSVPKKDTELDN